jgi:hypothetical protein
MELVYFEFLQSDGSTESTLIPRDRLEQIRPLNSDERDFAAKLGEGYFGDAPFARRTAYEKMIWGRSQPGRDFQEAEARRYDVIHHNANSILETTKGERFALPQTVDEIAASTEDLIVVGGCLKSRKPAQPGAAPQLERGVQNLLTYRPRG